MLTAQFTDEAPHPPSVVIRHITHFLQQSLCAVPQRNDSRGQSTRHLGFRHVANEICILMGIYAPFISNSLPTFRNNLSAPYWRSSSFLDHSILLTYAMESRVLQEKLASSVLVKKFPAFYGNRRLISAFTGSRQLSISYASSISSCPHIPLPEDPS